MQLRTLGTQKEDGCRMKDVHDKAEDKETKLESRKITFLIFLTNLKSTGKKCTGPKG